MALQTQVVPVPIVGGLNTKPDERDLPPGDLSYVVNGEFRQGNKITKRNGYAEFSNGIAAPNSIPGASANISSGRGVASDGKNLFCLDQTSVYCLTRDEQIFGSKPWLRLATLFDADTELVSIESVNEAASTNTSYFSLSTLCVLNNTGFTSYPSMIVHAYIVPVVGGSTYQARIIVQDRITENILSVFTVSNVIVSDSTKIRAITINNQCLVLIQTNTTEISCYALNNTTLQITPTPVWQINDLSGSFFDVAGMTTSQTTMPTQGVIVYKTSTGFNAKQFTETALSSTQVISVAVTGGPQGDLAVTNDLSGSRFYVLCSTTTNDVTVYGFNLLVGSITTRFGPNIVTGGSLGSDTMRQAVGIGIAATQFEFFYEVLTASTSNPTTNEPSIARYSADSNGSNQSGSTGEATSNLMIRGVAIASKPFIAKDANQVCLGAILDSTDQGNLFIITEGPLNPTTYAQRLHAQIVSRVGLGAVKRYNASDIGFFTENAALINSNQSDLIFSRVTISGFDKATNAPIQGLGVVKFNTTTKKRLEVKKGLTGTFINASQLLYYDGAGNTNELGFNAYPIIKLAAGGTGGSLVSGSTYTYKAVYSWVDADGRIHQSAPSLAASLSPGGSNTKINVTASTLRDGMTTKSFIAIDFYRTAASGTSFHYVGTAQNSTAVDYVTYTDGLSDSDLNARPLLYTESGELPNNPIPSPQWIEIRNGHLFAIVGDNQLWNSKIEDINSGPSFSASLLQILQTQYGSAISLAALDDKLIIFHELATYVLSGDGPNNLGQGDFFGPTLVAGALGTFYPRSVLTSEYGVFFQSARGIYLLDRSLSYNYIGEKVQGIIGGGDINNFVVEDSSIVNIKSQARFRINFSLNQQDLSAGTLVCELQSLTGSNGPQNRWSFHADSLTDNLQYFATAHDQTLHQVIDDRYYIQMLSDGRFIAEQFGLFADSFFSLSLQQYSLAIRTGWIHLAGMQGFERIKKVSFLGKNLSAHGLTITLNYDYESLFAAPHLQTVTVNSATITTEPYQIRIAPAYQQCEAIQVVVSELPSNPNASLGGSLDMYELSLEIAGKGGIFRLPVANTK